MSKCIGYKRKAKFAPGSELIDETNHFLVIDIIKDCEPGSYLYKVYDYDTKQTTSRVPYKIEKMSFLNLVNIGNYRLLHGDVDGEEEEEKEYPKIEYINGGQQIRVTFASPKETQAKLESRVGYAPTLYYRRK